MQCFEVMIVNTVRSILCRARITAAGLPASGCDVQAVERCIVADKVNFRRDASLKTLQVRQTSQTSTAVVSDLISPMHDLFYLLCQRGSRDRNVRVHEPETMILYLEA